MSILGHLASHASLQYRALMGEIAALRNYVQNVGTIPDHVVVEVCVLLSATFVPAKTRID